MRVAPLKHLSAIRAGPGGAVGGAPSAFSPAGRRSFQPLALARQDGRLYSLRMTIGQAGGGEAPASLEHGLIRDFSARTTAERLAAFALRKFLADGVPPSRAAIERAFDETQAAVEKGVRLALRLLRRQGAGAEALGGGADFGAEAREALARWRAGELGRLGGDGPTRGPPPSPPPGPRAPRSP
ncbi:MAG: hypothetical protein HYY66_12295 [Candidatus Tectomicrobia bacterium]|nr:hypothetical protein [Candidatus Tectomicrobia bacterium]